MFNLKLFQTELLFIEERFNNYIEPWVSYTELNLLIKYNKVYAEKYMTTVALGSGTISFNIYKEINTDLLRSISYSTDNGKTWNTTQNSDNKSENILITVNVNNGDKILWKGDADSLAIYSDEEGENIGSFFSSTINFNAEGNIMSLLYEDNFVNQLVLESNNTFCRLFSDYYEELECLIVNAENLILPATILTLYCYKGMFYGCTNLAIAPELPATTLASSCYYLMFFNCTSLTTAPELPATTLADYCYSWMFYNCTSLTMAPELPATTLTNECYVNMFSNCTNLTSAPELPATTLDIACYLYMFDNCTSLATAPELPATTLTDSCYYNMFSNCTSLATAPELPATILAHSCYLSMFGGCTSLTTAPELPATTLAKDCYSNMFEGCTNLTTAPELPATTLTDSCYQFMFNGCTNLNYIKAMFITTPSTTYTQNWVSGVASSGTFVKNSAATWNVTGLNGVPSGWTVQTASA